MDRSSRELMQPIPPSDRVRQVEAALSDYVERAGLKAGDRLPAERELMAALGVGRSTIREVIRKFQALGVIDSRKGSGNYLLKPISAATVHMPISIDAESLRDADDAGSTTRHRSGGLHGRRSSPHGRRYRHHGSAAR